MDSFTLGNYLRRVEADPKVKSNYKERYKEISNQIESTWYIIGDKGPLVIHLRIPSEKVDNVFYDTLFEFATGKNTTLKDFRQSEVKIFSNCPSFVYMNAKICKEKGYLVPWASVLINPRAFEDGKKDAKEESSSKDKPNDVRYEKSLYFSALYLNALNPIDILKKISRAHKVASERFIINKIKDTSWVEGNRSFQSAKEKQHMFRDKAKEEKLEAKSKSKAAVGKIASTPKTKSISKVKKVRHI